MTGTAIVHISSNAGVTTIFQLQAKYEMCACGEQGLKMEDQCSIIEKY